MSAAATKVKLCGMSREADLDAVAQAKPDFVGFIVDFPRSHRSIPPQRLTELVSYLRERDPQRHIACVGVFVDKPAEDVAHITREAGLDAVQLHGGEDEAYIARLRPLLPDGVKIIRAFRVRTQGDVAAAEASAADMVQLHGGEDEAYIARLRPLLPDGVKVIRAFRVRMQGDVAAAEASAADMVLLDNGQGTGKAFDWSLVAPVRRPFILAGGLTPENVAAAIAGVRPWGVDMSSGIETGGLKDPTKIAAAVQAVRSA